MDGRGNIRILTVHKRKKIETRFGLARWILKNEKNSFAFLNVRDVCRRAGHATLHTALRRCCSPWRRLFNDLPPVGQTTRRGTRMLLFVANNTLKDTNNEIRNRAERLFLGRVVELGEVLPKIVEHVVVLGQFDVFDGRFPVQALADR